MSQNRYKFICPKCKHNKIEEVLINVTQYTTIDKIDSDGDFKYGERLAEDGEVQNYQCSKCGFVIEMDDYNAHITDPVELVEWIKKNCRQD